MRERELTDREAAGLLIGKVLFAAPFVLATWLFGVGYTAMAARWAWAWITGQS